ncbi:MAG: uridine phosphorylase, partial [Thermoprotei archaeon]
IRVGTTAALTRNIELGDVIISIAAVRLEGTSKAYAPPEYPAFANYEVLLALIEAAETLGIKYHVGITASTDSFYVGQERPGYHGYMPPWSKGLINMLRSLKVLNFEMEASVIFVLASIYGARAGSICAAIANRETDEFLPGVGVDNAIKVANEAVKILYEWDSIKRQKRKTYLSPSILIKHWHK